MAYIGRSFLTDDSECSCSGKSPTYTPKFSSMSDEDLDCLELLYLAIINGVTPTTELPTYAAVQELFSPCSCWLCLSPRQRRERMLAKMIDMTPCWTAEETKAILRLILSKTTPNQRKAAIECLRYAQITSVNCNTLFPT